MKQNNNDWVFHSYKAIAIDMKAVKHMHIQGVIKNYVDFSRCKQTVSNSANDNPA